ncbi:MAG TPA: hypothetical protein ENH62_05235 [Marinobacter sp.]|uniref:Uncharacterized protein n=1 Tax=marine sediment metagenome TaxID=412755 RepID=A0A0F9VGS6_9ZZZZ|nr:hypothetical protein [Marinobacter sp.]
MAQPTITPGSFNKLVASAGVAEALSSVSLKVMWFLVQAIPGNTGNVFLGASDVDSTRGLVIEPSMSQPVNLDVPDAFHAGGLRLDLSEWYIDAANSADGVVVLYGLYPGD